MPMRVDRRSVLHSHVAPDPPLTSGFTNGVSAKEMVESGSRLNEARQQRLQSHISAADPFACALTLAALASGISEIYD